MSEVSVGIVVENPFHVDLGFSIRTRELSIGLSELGCRVHVFSPFDRDHSPFPNIFVHNTSGNRRRIYSDFRRLIRRFSKTKSVGRFFYLSQTLSFLASRASESVIDCAKGLSLDILQGTQATTSSVACKVASSLKLPTVAGIGALLPEEAVQAGIISENSNIYRSCSEFVRRVLSNCDGTICVSEPMRDYLIDSYGSRAETTWVIPNGTRLMDETADTVPQRPRTAPMILYAGILDTWERVDIAIDAMRYVVNRFPSARLLIVGDGRLKAKLLATAEKTGLSAQIEFVGLRTRTETFELMRQADVAVLPSSNDIVRRLACPIKMFDYLSAGVPIVTTGTGWWSDMIASSGAGLVTSQNPSEFAEGICAVIAHQDRESFSKNGTGIARQYDWRRISENLLDVYNAVRKA